VAFYAATLSLTELEESTSLMRDKMSRIGLVAAFGFLLLATCTVSSLEIGATTADSVSFRLEETFRSALSVESQARLEPALVRRLTNKCSFSFTKNDCVYSGSTTNLACVFQNAGGVVTVDGSLAVTAPLVRSSHQFI